MLGPMFRSRRLFLVLAMVILSLPLFVLACGGDEEAPSGGESPPAGETPATGAVSQGDNFFDPDVHTVSAGQTATFYITNDGEAIHNMRIAGPDGEYETEDDALSDPDAISAGSTATLEWTAPDEPGTIDFRCDFHPTEMVGTITVE